MDVYKMLVGGGSWVVAVVAVLGRVDLGIGRDGARLFAVGGIEDLLLVNLCAADLSLTGGPGQSPGFPPCLLALFGLSPLGGLLFLLWSASAARLWLRIRSPYLINTNGTTPSTHAIAASSVEAYLGVSFSYICCENSGKQAAKVLRRKLCAARALLAYRSYTSARYENTAKYTGNSARLKMVSPMMGAAGEIPTRPVQAKMNSPMGAKTAPAAA